LFFFLSVRQSISINQYDNDDMNDMITYICLWGVWFGVEKVEVFFGGACCAAYALRAAVARCVVVFFLLRGEDLLFIITERTPSPSSITNKNMACFYNESVAKVWCLRLTQRVVDDSPPLPPPLIEWRTTFKPILCAATQS
jgi:hypothetical protein